MLSFSFYLQICSQITKNLRQKCIHLTQFIIRAVLSQTFCNYYRKCIYLVRFHILFYSILYPFDKLKPFFFAPKTQNQSVLFHFCKKNTTQCDAYIQKVKSPFRYLSCIDSLSFSFSSNFCPTKLCSIAVSNKSCLAMKIISLDLTSSSPFKKS